MLLHHFVTVALIVFSYMLNYIGTAVTVIFLHDVSDLPLVFTKIFSETRLMKVSLPSFLVSVVTWLCLRLLYYPYIIYLVYSLYQGEEKFCHGVVVFFLSILVVLHYFWFYMFIQILLYYKKKGDGDDIITHSSLRKSKKY